MNALCYPATSKLEHVDTYHGVEVPDPYRWLEDELNAERATWIAAQNSLTAKYLAQLPERKVLRNRFEELLRYPRYYELYRRGPYLLYKKNEGLQNQLVLHLQRGLTGSPEVVVDPRTLAPDGTVRIATFTLSWDARYLGYALSEGGSDWHEVRVTDLQTRADLGDRIRWMHGPPVAWRRHGFYYSRYPVPASAASALSAASRCHQVWYHHVGAPQSEDVLVYEDPRHPRRLHFAQTTEDERFVVLSIVNYGEGYSGNAVLLLDTERCDRAFRPLVTTFDNVFHVVDTMEGGLVCVTDLDAPNRRIVRIDPARPEKHYWKEIVPERKDALEQVMAIAGKLFAVYRQDATHRLFVIDREGSVEDEIPLPGLGLVHVFSGQATDADALWSFSSFTIPPTVYRYDLVTRQSTAFLVPALSFTPDHYRTTQVFYPSKDGTRVPMFLVHRKNLELDGRHPSLLYGYGGYGAAIGPAFDPLLVTLLERGVIFAVACLRGGGEYGEAAAATIPGGQPL